MPPRGTAARLCAAAALVLLVLLLVGWGSGENGDLPFAAVAAAIAAGAFVIGAWSGRWWVALASAVCWFVGWYVEGVLIQPDSYAWAAAFFAPALLLFAGLGVGARRGRRS